MLHDPLYTVAMLLSSQLTMIAEGILDASILKELGKLVTVFNDVFIKLY